jgi:hypothetical protein
VSSPPWFRFYSETVHDAKLDRVALIAEVDKVVALGAWAGLLALSNESSVRGHLLLCDGIPFTVGELASKIGMDEPLLEKILEGFAGVKMVHWEDDTLVITNMGKRQFTSDHSAERVRKHRETKKGNDDVTEEKRYTPVTETPPDTDTEPDTKTDSELDSDTTSAIPQKIMEVQLLPVAKIKRKKMFRAEWEQLLEYERAQDKPRKGLIAFINRKLANGHVTPEQRQYLALFGAEGFANPTQARTVQEAINTHGLPLVIEVATWAANKQFTLGHSIATLGSSIETWKKPRQQSRGSPGKAEPKGFQGIRDFIEEVSGGQSD